MVQALARASAGVTGVASSSRKWLASRANSAPRLDDLRQARDDLLRRSFYHDVWVAARGVGAIRDFNGELDPLRYGQFSTKEEVERYLNDKFNELRKKLCKDLGYTPD